MLQLGRDWGSSRVGREDGVMWCAVCSCAVWLDLQWVAVFGQLCGSHGYLRPAHLTPFVGAVW